MQPNTCIVLLYSEMYSRECRKIVLMCNAAASHQHHCRVIEVLCDHTHVCLLSLSVCLCVCVCLLSLCVSVSVCACVPAAIVCE